MIKTWNARDTPKEQLESLLREKYKQIEESYKILKRLATAEDAKKLIDEIYRLKSFANEIELELIRRNFTNDLQE